MQMLYKTKIERNRAGYENILEFARRENNNIDMEMCKKLINNLIAKNMVINKGKNGNYESFKIVEKNDDISKSTDVSNEESKKYCRNK